MSITSASILEDGTVATTGGTATTFIPKYQSGTEHVVILNDGSEFIAQTEIVFSVRDPKVSVGSPNGYSQARSSVVVKEPLALDNGEVTTNTLRITLSVDHETTAAEIESMLVRGAQLLHDSDFSDFWKKQSLG